MLRLQVVAECVKSESEQAHQLIEQALARADAVLEEGRDRVQDLRTTERAPLDLSQILLRVGEGACPHTTRLRVTVEGSTRELRKAVRDEIEKIGIEAITNALHHAKASRVEVDILFERRQFALCVRDDGIGIDAEIVNVGREGHFGLTGMRERAQQIRGAISIASGSNVGTEIEIVVPAGIAYVPRRMGTAGLWLRRAARELLLMRSSGDSR
jgi:signal transduction histidine kinase